MGSRGGGPACGVLFPAVGGSEGGPGEAHGGKVVRRHAEASVATATKEKKRDLAQRPMAEKLLSPIGPCSKSKVVLFCFFLKPVAFPDLIESPK